MAFLCGPVAQLGARFHGMEEVVGSIPTRSTKSSINYKAGAHETPARSESPCRENRFLAIDQSGFDPAMLGVVHD